MNIHKNLYVFSQIIFIILVAIITLILFDSFKNSFFLFQGGLGTLGVIVGYISIIFDFKNKVIGKKLKIFSLIILSLFCLIYSLLSPDISIIFLLFFVAIIINLILIYLASKNNNSNTVNSLPNGKYIKTNIWLKLYILINTCLLIYVWSYPFETNFNIFVGPNGEGLTSYINELENPKLSINIDGGFIYNIFDENVPSYKRNYIEDKKIMGAIDIKLNKPYASIKIIPIFSGKLIINLLNYNDTNELTINGDVYTVNKNDADNFEVKSQIYTDYELIGSLVSNSYIDYHSSYSLYLELEQNKEYNIEINTEENDDEQWTFYSISDLHGGINVMVPIFKSFLENKPDFIIANGDLVNNGNKSEYMVISELFNSYPTPIYTSIGNHDIWDKGQKYYPSFFGPYYYSFIYKNATFIVLNDSSGIIGESQFEWLENELKNVPTEFTFIVAHMSPIDTATGIFDDSLNISAELNQNIHSKAESDKLLNLCDKYNVDYFLAGHSHIYGSTTINNTTYVTSGVLGGSAGEKHDIGYLKINMSNNSSNAQFVDCSKYYDTSILKRFQTLKVFLIPALRGASIRLLISITIIIINYILWLLFKKKIVYIIK